MRKLSAALLLGACLGGACEKAGALTQVSKGRTAASFTVPE